MISIAIEPVDERASRRPTARTGVTATTAKLSVREHRVAHCTTSRLRRPSRLSRALRTLSERSPRTKAGPKTLEATEALSEAPPETALPSTQGTPPQPAHGVDRRRFLRRSSTQLVRVIPDCGIPVDEEDLDCALHESPCRGRMVNISMNGVAFLLPKPLAVSARVWLKLESRTREFAVTRAARIVRAAPAADTGWMITCRFDHSLPYADVLLLGHDLG